MFEVSKQMIKVEEKTISHLNFFEVVQTSEDKMKSYVEAMKLAFISLSNDRKKYQMK